MSKLRRGYLETIHSAEFFFTKDATCTINEFWSLRLDLTLDAKTSNEFRYGRDNNMIFLFWQAFYFSKRSLTFQGWLRRPKWILLSVLTTIKQNCFWQSFPSVQLFPKWPLTSLSRTWHLSLKWILWNVITSNSIRYSIKC